MDIHVDTPMHAHMDNNITDKAISRNQVFGLYAPDLKLRIKWKEQQERHLKLKVPKTQSVLSLL